MQNLVRRVLASDTDPQHASSDETCDPRQDVITEAEDMVQPVDEDVMVHSVEGSGQI